MSVRRFFRAAFLFCLLALSAAHAGEVVLSDGTIATAILRLDINGTLYDVSFERDSFNNLHAAGKFPFYDDLESTDVAAAAITGALNLTVADEVGLADGSYASVGFTHPVRPLGEQYQTNKVRISDLNSSGVWRTIQYLYQTSYDQVVLYAVLTESPVLVEIDIDPWSTADIVRPESNDPIYVAVMGQSITAGDLVDFDVAQIDPGSLQFGADKAPNTSQSPLYGDQNNDSVNDAVFTFGTQAAGIPCDSTEVMLQGLTLAGDEFVATANIITTDCMAPPNSLSIVDVSGSTGVGLHYDLSSCSDSVSGAFTTVAADLTPEDPGCEFLANYGEEGWTIRGAASATEPVITSHSISTWNSVDLEMTSNAPFWILGGASTQTLVTFTVDTDTDLLLNIVQLEGSRGGTSLWDSSEPVRGLSQGSAVVSVEPGQYRLMANLDDDIHYNISTTTRKVELSVVPAAVEIDVNPWNSPNNVDPDSNGTMYIAVKGSDPVNGDARNFDVEQIDPASLRFGTGEAPNIALTPLYGDNDGDGNNDAIYIFETEDSGIACGDTEISLQGETLNGHLFAGTDTIVTPECEAGGCHP